MPSAESQRALLFAADGTWNVPATLLKSMLKSQLDSKNLSDISPTTIRNSIAAVNMLVWRANWLCQRKALGG